MVFTKGSRGSREEGPIVEEEYPGANSLCCTYIIARMYNSCISKLARIAYNSNIPPPLAPPISFDLSQPCYRNIWELKTTRGEPCERYFTAEGPAAYIPAILRLPASYNGRDSNAGYSLDGTPSKTCCLLRWFVSRTHTETGIPCMTFSLTFLSVCSLPPEVRSQPI